MTRLRRGDADLHTAKGEHIMTVPIPSDRPISGSAVARWQERIQAHLAEHAAVQPYDWQDEPNDPVVTTEEGGTLSS